tara:strand:- start:269 stop:1186 length:918 start_codon:yes stop_codon:yes gene_type:complete
MAGILDSKTRILDTIVTQEGRRQLASGDFQVEFVTFTDGATFYQASVASGSADAGARIYFEATSNPKDSIVIERDLNGNLFYFDGSDVRVLGESILSGSSVLTGSDFKAHIPTLVKSTPRHFNDLYALKTKDPFQRKSHFSTNITTASFSITRNSPLRSFEIKKLDLDNVESIFQDKRTSHINNFKYLPPVNKKTNNVDFEVPLGNYKNLNQQPIFTLEELQSELKGKDFQTVEFPETSNSNNLVCQFFETDNNKFRKLEVIDFGEFIVSEEDASRKHIFFVGKSFVDENGSLTFVNLFTLVFES